MYAVQTYAGATGSNCKVPCRRFAKSPIHFAMTPDKYLNPRYFRSIAKSLQSSNRQSVAKLCKVQCFQACKALQSRIAKSHPYGGRPGARRLVAAGLPPLVFWGRERGRNQGSIREARGILYRPLSAGWC